MLIGRCATVKKFDSGTKCPVKVIRDSKNKFAGHFIKGIGILRGEMHLGFKKCVKIIR